MRAAVCRAYGPPESIAVEENYPAPALAEGRVRVRVGAAAVSQRRLPPQPGSPSMVA